MYKNSIKDLTFNFTNEPSGEVLEDLMDIMSSSAKKNTVILGGRGSVKLGNVRGFGDIVLKEYYRGGFIGKFNRYYFLKSTKSRPQIEYDFLVEANSLGLNVPKPLGYIIKHNLIYRGWLVTEMLNSKWNLANLSMSDEERTRLLVHSVVDQILKLIENKIFHVDLHPGNVLVDEDNTIFLIDFDKARYFSGTKNKLRDLYLHRWRRAVIKHNLPEYLSEYICAGLRKNF